MYKGLEEWKDKYIAQIRGYLEHFVRDLSKTDFSFLKVSCCCCCCCCCCWEEEEDDLRREREERYTLMGTKSRVRVFKYARQSLYEPGRMATARSNTRYLSTFREDIEAEEEDC
tara:strand:- start:134 stop:475 length:342 start_codon:yes stop_codon:yes gene_type:complete